MPIAFDQTYFEGTGELGYSSYQRDHKYLQAEKDFILANFNLAGISCLEVGCGYGYLTEMMRADGLDWQGVDISSYAIGRDVTGGNIQQGDVLGTLPYGVNSFRFVCGIYVLECLETQAQIDVAVNEIRRVAHPTSDFYFVVSLGSPTPHWQQTVAQFDAYILSKFPSALLSDGIAFEPARRVVIK
jgi:ubiquinone/menaquinone biosynthesis C-methylase UbiE